jgi:uncharacterized protein YjbJ (UPF0337 family)
VSSFRPYRRRPVALISSAGSAGISAPGRKDTGMDRNRMDGIGLQVKGTLKQMFGKVIGDSKLTADGAAERAAGDARNAVRGDLLAGIDTDRIIGVGHEIKGAVRQGFGTVIGDPAIAASGSAERAAGKVQNAAGGARDMARETAERDRAAIAAENPAETTEDPPIH